MGDDADGAGKVPRAAFMTACEVLTWIAFGEPLTSTALAKEAEAARDWGADVTDELLRALEGRSAPQPYCAVRPVAPRPGRRGAPPHATRYAARALSPEGPRILRRVRARAREHSGRWVTFAEVAAELRPELAARTEAEGRLERARAELLAALRAAKLTARGRRTFDNGATDPSARMERIDAELFFDPLITVTTFDRVGVDASLPIGDWVGRRWPDFEEVQFSTAEVLALWPPGPRPPAGEQAATPEMPAAPAAGAPAPRPVKSRGGRPPIYDWPAFRREALRAANLDGFATRLEMMRHMRAWVARTWSSQPDETTLQRQLAELYPADLPER